MHSHACGGGSLCSCFSVCEKLTRGRGTPGSLSGGRGEVGLTQWLRWLRKTTCQNSDAFQARKHHRKHPVFSCLFFCKLHVGKKANSRHNVCLLPCNWTTVAWLQTAAWLNLWSDLGHRVILNTFVRLKNGSVLTSDFWVTNWAQ